MRSSRPPLKHRLRGLGYRLQVRCSLTTAFPVSDLEPATDPCFLRGNAPLSPHAFPELGDISSRQRLSVIDKTTLPPSGDPHDYWHPAPYYWPNPNTKDGIPYIERDGQRVPGTRLYEPESDRYDRSRLQRLFDDSTLLTLAWKATGNADYARHAANHLKCWFVDPATRMNPHLRYAQIIMTSRKGKWSSAGIIETKDFYYYLDAVRILIADGFIDNATLSAFKSWLAEFLQWLLTSPHGRRECAKPNNHGLYYDLQVAAIAAFLGDTKTLSKTLGRARIRLFQHFPPDGSQPYELVRTLSLHYCAFNLQGWANLAHLAEQCGVDLWHHRSRDGRCLKNAFAWLLAYFPKREWPFQQIAPFDWNRLVPLAAASDRRYGTTFLSHAGRLSDGSPDYPFAFHPHDGIPVGWQLCPHLSPQNVTPA